jgi:hypothetical protein
MQVARALITAGAGLTLVYLLAIFAYLAVGSRRSDTLVPDDGIVRYEVKTGAGQTHIVEHPTDDPAGVLEETTRRFGEVASVVRLEPGQVMSHAAQTVSPALAFAALLFPLTLLGVGFYARGRAARLQKFERVISRSLTADARSVQATCGLNDAGLENAIARMNTAGCMQLTWDKRTHRVYDRRLSDHTIVVQHCPSCNEAVNMRVIADLQTVPQCKSCMNMIDRHTLDQLKAGVVQNLVKDNAVDTGADFSVGVLVALALLFPPGAIFYGLRHA